MGVPDSVALAPIAEVAGALRRGEFSVVELVESALDRIAAGSELNAVSIALPGRALRAAWSLDEELAAGRDRGPLHGIPITVKDNFDVAGVPTMAGSTLLPRIPAPESAPALAAMERAGAVLVAKTNMYELAYGGPNPAFGSVLNPWCGSRATGGSSSGAAVSVAAGLAYAALGSDSGGSIRIPAAYCGVSGFKPTVGLVSSAGVVPVSPTLDHVGPIARSVEDMALVMKALVPAFGDLGDASPAGIRVGTLDPSAYEPVQTAVRQALAAAKEGLRSGGAVVWTAALPSFDTALDVKWTISAVEAADTHRQILAKQRNRIQPLVRQLLEEGEAVTGTAYRAALRERFAIQDQMASEMNCFDALVIPAVETTAPALGQEVPLDADESSPLRSTTRFMSLLSVSGYPAVTVPFGTDDDGLPLSLQVVGPRGRDCRVLRTARAVSKLAPPLDAPPDAVRIA